MKHNTEQSLKSIQKSTVLDKFKQQIIMWKPATCNCKLCNTCQMFISKFMLVLYFLFKLVFISYFTVTICLLNQ